MGKATEKQITYACAIADKLGLERPMNDFDECRTFISEYREEYLRKLWIDEVHNGDDISYDVYGYNKFIDSFGEKAAEWTLKNLSCKAGVYCFISNGTVVYIGKSMNLAQRIPTSYRERVGQAKINKIMYYITPSKADAGILEMILIAENKPILNVDGNVTDYPILFRSNIDILKTFDELPTNQ